MTDRLIMAKAIERHIQTEGIKMRKRISSGGLFSDDTYDNRIVYSLREMHKLTDEGFSIAEDVGVFLLNAFL
jgi:hypothetical protein